MKIPCKSHYQLLPADALKISIKYCNCLGESISEFPLPQTIWHMYNYYYLSTSRAVAYSLLKHYGVSPIFDDYC
jgi:hypothetical protein